MLGGVASSPDHSPLEQASHAPNGTQALDEKQHRRINKCALWCALGLVIGLALGCFMGVYLIPHGAQGAMASALPGGQGQNSINASHAPQAKGEASLTINATEDPVKAVRTSDGAMWIFPVVVKNVGELPFTVEQVEQQVLTGKGKYLSYATSTPVDLGWGQGVILPGCDVSFTTGFPVQEIQCFHVIVNGKDGNGNALSFEGDVNLAMEIAE